MEILLKYINNRLKELAPKYKALATSFDSCTKTEQYLKGKIDAFIEIREIIEKPCHRQGPKENNYG